MVTKLKDLRMKRNAASLINEEDDRLRKPQHLSKTESDVLLYYILESDDAKKLEIKDPIIYYFEKRSMSKQKPPLIS